MWLAFSVETDPISIGISLCIRLGFSEWFRSFFEKCLNSPSIRQKFPSFSVPTELGKFSQFVLISSRHRSVAFSLRNYLKLTFGNLRRGECCFDGRSRHPIYNSFCGFRFSDLHINKRVTRPKEKKRVEINQMNSAHVSDAYSYAKRSNGRTIGTSAARCSLRVEVVCSFGCAAKHESADLKKSFRNWRHYR